MLSGDIPGTSRSFDLSDDGSLLAFLANEDGFSKLHLARHRDRRGAPGPRAAGRRRRRPQLPPRLATRSASRLSWARSPSDVYSYDPDSRKLERWTASEVGGLNPASFAVPELVRYPHLRQAAPGERRTIPAFVYRAAGGPLPGPAAGATSTSTAARRGRPGPSFLGSNNYLINELGVALIVPNVRGSTGYGKTYLQLDNGKKREDSVKDIGALLDWIATQPDLDASRVMVSGGSYGGYMVLAALVHYSDRLCCASSRWASATS